MNFLMEQLQELQDTLAIIEMLNRPSRDGDFLEILIRKLEHIQIRMEGDKAHKTPHIHINIGKTTHAASYEIVTGKRIVGSRSIYEKAVSKWVVDHRADLVRVWDLMQAGKDVTAYVEELKGS